MDVAHLGLPFALGLGAMRARNGADPGSKGAEDRVDVLHRRIFAADHHAVAALQPPDAARHADVDESEASFLQPLGSLKVVLPEAVAAVDNNIALARDAADFTHH